MIRESFSERNGFEGRSYETPLALTDCLIGNAHIPRPPPTTCTFRFTLVGRSLCGHISLDAIPQSK